MNDIFDEIERVGRSGSQGMGKRLRSASVKDVLVAASRKGRRRTAARRGGVGVGVLGLLALGAWAIPGHGNAAPVKPAVVGLSDATVGPIEPYLSAFPRWCLGSDGAGIYVPYGEPGVTISDPSVADLDLTVEATLTSRALGGYEATAVTPSAMVDFDLTPAGGSVPAVQFRVTWEGEESLTVLTSAYLVSDGWGVSQPSIQHINVLEGDQAEAPRVLPEFDAATGRSTKVAFIDMTPSCLSTLPGGPGERIPAGGVSELHTLIQVMDSEGTPIAMFIDATGLESTSVTFGGLLAAGATVALRPVTDQDREDALALRQEGLDKYAAQGGGRLSAGATFNAVLADEGAPLGDAVMGYRPLTTCENHLDEWGSYGFGLPVVRAPLIPADTNAGATLFASGNDWELPRIPRTWSLADVNSGFGDVPFGEAEKVGYTENEWYTGYFMTIIFTEVDDPSVVRGVITGQMAWKDPAWTSENSEPNPDFVDSPDTAVLSFFQPGSCDDISGLTPGSYHAVVVVAGAPIEFRDSRLSTYEEVAATWIDYGIITITD